MKFLIKHPCKLCPFRKDVRPFLRRAPEIAASLAKDYGWFACHETTGVKYGRRVQTKNQSHCMGAARVLWRAGLANVAMRLALVFGMIETKELEASMPPVFASLEEFAAHHEKS